MVSDQYNLYLIISLLKKLVAFTITSLTTWKEVLARWESASSPRHQE